jgi:xanthine dehydrogenase YagT iron-sulfur-binding subunit
MPARAAKPELDHRQIAPPRNAYRDVEIRRSSSRSTGIVVGITRREFLKGTGASLAGVAVPGGALRAAEQPATVPNARAAAHGGPREILLDVNRVQRAVTVEPQMTLAEVLRGPLDLMGTKIACDRGACSACTVWIDRAPVLACMTLAVDVGERKVVTIEGLASGGTLHPVQSAFVGHDAMQCGFCTPGLVMSCAALLERNPAPSAEDVRAAISGHLCRCGSTPHAIEAVLDAAKAVKG